MPQFISIAGTDHPVQPGPIHPQWREAAEAHGFTPVARIRDRLSLALRCHACGGLLCKRFSSLASHVPRCNHCHKRAKQAKATSAGLVFLRRDPEHRKYAFYQADCGHEIRRQFGRIERIAKEEAQHRCEICHHTREQGEAEARGWELVGRDPEGELGYRLYRHAEGCGAEARIARVNMQTGRFCCPECGESWATAPSFLYLMRFELGSGEKVVKFGFSRDPASRMNFQLPRRPDLPRALLHTVPMQTGQKALKVEQRLHRQLKAAHPGALVPPEVFAGDLKVKSEIYAAYMERPILAELRRIARGQIPKPRQGGRPPKRKTWRSDQPRPGRRARNSC